MYVYFFTLFRVLTSDINRFEALNVILNVVIKGKMSTMFRISGCTIDMEHKVVCTSCQNMGYLHNPVDTLDP